MQPEKILHSQDVSDPARRSFLSKFVIPFRLPPEISDFDIQLEQFLKVVASRRDVIGASIFASAVYAWPRLWKSFFEFIRAPQALILKELSEIAPNSVAFGYSPHMNKLHEMQRNNEQINYTAPAVNLFHHWTIHRNVKNDYGGQVNNPYLDLQDEHAFKNIKEFIDQDVLVMVSSGFSPGGESNGQRVFGEMIDNPEVEAYLHRLARQFRDLGKTVLFRPFFEMNGNWWNYGASEENSAEDFKKAWQKLVTVFREEGADNVLFVWCPNSTVNPLTTRPVKDYYPDDESVHIVGLNVFDRHEVEFVTSENGGLRFNVDGHFVQPDASALANFGLDLEFLQSTGKPMIVAELGSTRRDKARADWEYSAVELAIRAGVRLILYFVWNKQDEDSPLEQNWMFEADDGMIEMANKVSHEQYSYQKSRRNNINRLVRRLFSSVH